MQILSPDVAAALRPSERQPKTVLEAMREAVSHGTKLLPCSDALDAHGIDAATLIPECHGRGSAVQFMARAADRRWRTLVF